MTTLTKPEVHFDEQRPIEFVPFFNPKKGDYQYWERLDVSRVKFDTFTYLSGAVYERQRNTKLKLQLSIDAKPMPHIGNITTYAVNDKTRAFSRQLRLVYGTGRRADIPYYCWHKNNVSKTLSDIGDSGQVEVQTGIPVCSGNSGNPLTTELMKDTMISLLKLGGKPIACVVSVGQFSKSYAFHPADMSKVSKKLQSGKDYPTMLFHDHRDDLFDLEE
ncbi:hypothetical protein [Photobacterium leiognathi]|uniref:hypothetical protein n=1 Tax=Photobacterium leiognathi TaxID=553611 RepID=UPI0029823C47|nr:hypothetical protein [Photobacterium leiognathi]